MPPSACTNFPTCLRTAPVNAPFSCPNSSDSISSSGIAAQLTRMNGVAGPRRQVVDAARDQLLAGARLADHQHRRPRRRDAGDPLAQRQHLGGVAEQRRLLVAALELAVLLGQPAAAHGVPHRQEQRGALGRLVEEGVRPGLQALRRGELVAVPGQDDDRHVDAAAAQVVEQPEPVHAGHLDVEQHGVRRLAVDAVERGEGVGRLADLEPRAGQDRHAPPCRLAASSSTIRTRPALSIRGSLPQP